MAAAIVSNLLEIIEKLEAFHHLQEHLSALKASLLRIQSVIADAEQKQLSDHLVSLWLRQIKDAAFDAEDILEEVRSFTTLPSQLTLNDLDEILERFEGIARMCESLRLRVCENAEPKPVASKSSVDVSFVLGREDDKNRIIETLLSKTICNLSVLPIVGTHGVGKTTLAELIFNNPRICGHFEPRIWVYAPQDLNLSRVMSAIVESILGDFGSVDDGYVRQLLEGKRFLLVLDDVRSQEHSLWELLKASLAVGLEGSAVILTTRSEPVGEIMGTLRSYHLKSLSNQDSWSLFQKYGCDEVNYVDYENLLDIAKKLVERCEGLPLLIKMLGGVLRSVVREDRLKSLLLREMGEINGGEKMHRNIMRLAYHCLPAQLKQCLIYCSMFPKDYIFRKARMVRLWMAQGFIRPEGAKQLEEIGVDYFDELFKRSFFRQFCFHKHQQNFSWHFQSNKQSFIMHELVHDFIEVMSGKENVLVDDCNMFSPFTGTRQVLLNLCNPEKKITFQTSDKANHLRSLLVLNRLVDADNVTLSWWYDVIKITIPNDIFSNLRYLRSLDLSGSKIKSLPDSIADLKLLQYLGLNRTKFTKLNEALCRLYNLQTLELHDCIFLKGLPRGIENLINLRHLLLPDHVHFTPMPLGIGKLTNLRTLSAFAVGREEGNCLISELKDLLNIQGSLCISGLSYVADVKDADMADLKSKEHIEKLRLAFGHAGPAFPGEETDDEEEEDDKKILQDDHKEENKDVNGFTEKYGTESIHEDEGIRRVDLFENNENMSTYMNDYTRKSDRIESFDAEWVSNFDLYDERSVPEDITQNDDKEEYVEGNGFKENYGNESIHEEEGIQKIDLFEIGKNMGTSMSDFIGKTDMIECLDAEWINNFDLFDEDSQLENAQKKTLQPKVPGQLDSAVLECLRPHAKLTELVIRFYNGIEFPNWIGDPGYTNMVSITITDCMYCEKLPALGQLPLLRYLSMEHFYKLKHVSHEFCCHENMKIGKAFRSLEILKFRYMYSWEEWFGVNDDDFPSLTELYLADCLKLRKLPVSFPFLKKLVLHSSKLEAFPMLPSLTILEVSLRNLSILPSISEEILHGLHSLKIWDCEDFGSLPLKHLSRLKELEISGCLMINGKELSLKLNDLAYLEILKIHYCPELWFSPEQLLPATLRVLDILRSPSLSEWCRRHGSSRLGHVSYVIIDKKDFHAA